MKNQKLALSSAENYPEVAAFRQYEARCPESFNVNIHADDEMFAFLLDAYKGDRDRALLAYFKSGQEVMTRVEQIINWKFQGWDRMMDFLDFACGYGRFTRFLVQAMSPDRVWVSDIYSEAVKFQQEEFGVNGMVSVSNPESYTCGQKFDCILVASLFSHLPERRFVPWLQKLFSLLSPDGVLIFSVHDEVLKPDALMMPESGILFIEISESKSLDRQEYGSTFVTEEFVKKAIAAATESKGSYQRIKRGLWRQDLYVIVRGEKQEKLTMELGIAGHLDGCVLKEHNKLRLRGWAANSPPENKVKEVQVWINGQLKQTCIPRRKRRDVSKYFADRRYLHAGWETECKLEGESQITGKILIIKAICEDRGERVLHLSTLERALSESPLRNKRQLRSRVLETVKRVYLRLANISLGAQHFGENLYHKLTDLLWNSFARAQGRCTRVKQLLSVAIDPDRQIKGCLDGVVWQGSELRLQGWASDISKDGKIKEIKVIVNGRSPQQRLKFVARPDVAKFLGDEIFINSGWICRCELTAAPQGDILVKAISSKNVERLLYAGTIEGALKL